MENGTGGHAVVTDLANGVSVALTPEAIRAGAVGAVAARLKEAYPEYADYVYTKAEQLEKQRQETVVAEVFYLAVGSVSMLIGLLFVATIMIVSVMERTREIGMLRALGISRRSIFVQIFIESMVLVLVGALIGIAPGYYGAAWAAESISADIGLTLVLSFSLPFMLKAMALVLAVGSLFAMYPASVATRMNIVGAITGVR
jgi:putative ABC transport system permease protein